MTASRARRAMGALASAGCLLGAAAPALASTSQQRASSTPRRALLRVSDLGRPWSLRSAAPSRVPRLTCHGFSPRLPGIGPPGTAASPTFENGPDGPFVSQSAYGYATAAQEQVVWRRVVTSRLLRCVATALRAGGGGGVSFTVTSRAVVPLHGAAADVARYRVGGSATGSGQTVPVYLDRLVLGRGALVTAVDVTSFGDPPADRLERRLVRLVVRRLAQTG